MGIFDIFKKRDKERINYLPQYLYSDLELKEFDAYIEKNIGKYDYVLHEIASFDIHLDVIMIGPSEKEPYQKLITMGCGAYKMNVPKEYESYDLDYAEYVIYLPKDWKLPDHSEIDSNEKEEDYWPIRALKDIGRLAIYTNSWLGYGHTIQGDEEGMPYANTKFNSMLLVKALNNDDKRMKLQLSSGKNINFYQLIPIYPEELNFKMENGADALLKKLLMTKDFPIVNINRKNVID